MTGGASASGAAAVWTDFGGVLTPPVAQTMARFCDAVGVEPAVMRSASLKVAAAYGVADPMEPLDSALVGEAEWTRQLEDVLAAEFGRTVRIGDFGEMWFADRRVNTGWLDHLHALKAEGVFVGMLSNMVPSWDRHWRSMVPPDTFDGIVMSYEVGFRKPMREIFEIALGRAGVPSHRCVLVDDLAANCRGAESAGWRAVEFSDTAEAISLLSRWTGPTSETEGNPS